MTTATTQPLTTSAGLRDHPALAQTMWLLAALGAVLAAFVHPAFAALPVVGAGLVLQGLGTVSRGDGSAVAPARPGGHEAERTRHLVAQRLGDAMTIERTRAAFDALRDSVVVVDGIGDVAFANPAARSVLGGGGGPGELRGRRAEELFDRAGFGPVATAIRELLEGSPEGGADGRWTGLERSGRVYDVEVVRAGDGIDTAAVCVAHDVTERHEVEKLKDRFLSSVSHELKTPLTNICSYTELLQDLGPEAAEWSEFVGVIETESQRLARHVQALVDFARIRAGLVHWRIEAVDPGRLLGQVVRLFSDRAAAASVQLELDLPDDAATASSPVLCDAAWVQRSLSEVMDNALKFGPRGGTVRIGLQLDRDAGLAVLSVEDDGPGVPRHGREEVFAELHQLGGVLTDKPHGIGLGLTLARAAAEGSGGRLVCVDPAGDGHGARFELELPLVGR